MASLDSPIRLVCLAALVALSSLPQDASGQDPAAPEPTPHEEAPAREPKELVTRRFERNVGERRFEVVVQASGWVDERALDYLAETLRVVALPKVDRADLWALRGVGAVVDPRADELTIALNALDGGDARAFSWLPPDGFEFVRPAVLRPRAELSQGLAKAQDFRFGEPAEPLPDARADAPRPFTRMIGRIMCEAWNGASKIVNPLPFVTVRVDGAEAQAGAGGVFELGGRFHGGDQRVGVVFSGTIGASSPQTPLQVMDDLHQSRSENRTATPARSGGDLVELDDVELSSVDCELFRLGAIVLEDYHQAVGTSPPAKKLRLKRWSGVWDGTPYAYYDYVVLTTSFPQSGAYATEVLRRETLFHEFGHSIRHVADGDEAHWGWDNFRWAYARIHTGCEVFNTQYAFNEGWANYWEDGRVRTRTVCAKPTLPPGFLDWNEDQIGKRLLELSNALCTPAAAGACRRRMVEVLEKNAGAIHSLWDFERRYCALHASGNPFCRSQTSPRRPAPAPCPPGFHDDGATCRLENVVAKPSYARGVGVVPTVCPSGQVLDAGLCYPDCQSGYSGVGPVCWQRCPAGFRDDGAFCGKPQPYGRRSYPWEFGDPPFDLGNARRRCERDHGAGKCEQDGLIFYPKCKPGFHNVGCCVCSPNCTGGMTDIGVSCAKKSYGRGAGAVPNRCQGGMEYDAGLCYQPCRSGFNGVGPVCWGSCPAGYDDHGATCYRPPNVIVKY